MTRPAWRASRPTGRYPLQRKEDYAATRRYWLARLPALCAEFGLPAPTRPTLEAAAHCLAASYKRRGRLSQAARDLLQVLSVRLMDEHVSDVARVQVGDTDATS
jgi:hypothetical protein